MKDMAMDAAIELACRATPAEPSIRATPAVVESPMPPHRAPMPVPSSDKTVEG